MSVYMILETKEVVIQSCSIKIVLLKFFLNSKRNISAGVSFFRRSYRRCSVKIVVLKNFAKLTGKHLYQGLFFNKVVGLRPANFIKKETLAQLFSCDFCEIFKSTFLTVHIWTTASAFLKNWIREEKKKGSSTGIFSWVLQYLSEH